MVFLWLLLCRPVLLSIDPPRGFRMGGVGTRHEETGPARLGESMTVVLVGARPRPHEAQRHTDVVAQSHLTCGILDRWSSEEASQESVIVRCPLQYVWTCVVKGSCIRGLKDLRWMLQHDDCLLSFPT